MTFSIEKGSKRAALVGGILFAIAGLIAMILVWSVWQARQPKLPLYPFAKEVTISDQDVIADSTGITKATVYRLSFETSDSPDRILTFYRDALPRQGWQLERTFPDGALIYHRKQDDGPVMGLEVSIGSSEQPKPLYVTLTMGTYAEMDRVPGLGR
jgi:hypothetical protein